jgi:hypothetical protein
MPQCPELKFISLGRHSVFGEVGDTRALLTLAERCSFLAELLTGQWHHGYWVVFLPSLQCMALTAHRCGLSSTWTRPAEPYSHLPPSSSSNRLPHLAVISIPLAETIFRRLTAESSVFPSQGIFSMTQIALSLPSSRRPSQSAAANPAIALWLQSTLRGQAKVFTQVRTYVNEQESCRSQIFPWVVPGLLELVVPGTIRTLRFRMLDCGAVPVSGRCVHNHPSAG